jgi:hypothetical protein
MPSNDRLPINTAPRDGTLIRLWCRSEAEPVTRLLVEDVHRLGGVPRADPADPA